MRIWVCYLDCGHLRSHIFRLRHQEPSLFIQASRCIPCDLPLVHHLIDPPSPSGLTHSVSSVRVNGACVLEDTTMLSIISLTPPSSARYLGVSTFGCESGFCPCANSGIG